ncbi:Kiwa anti-phage protein KwaB-like domain-containing protein [Clostridium sp. 001]|uniref:Kiwa anti-phage protein KwaB-like domain-containing protein n=1 Tax=Clostridium sp. 001 TaxID=1970093 RepID=UPI001C2BAA04|nr:Kiwa anti-phage protein KwaB-like domain-containing protein [Clostridium sp. 001]QXE19312.1 hypothetical protein B5S50_11020 [Clostridium sp. 001]
MPYRRILNEVQQQLVSDDNDLCLFLQTNNDIYSFRSELTPNQQLDIIQPIGNYLKDKEYDQYDPLEIRPNTIYYISNEMEENQSLNNILNLNHQIECGDVKRATIKTIENDKIKLIIFKKDRFLFLYRYDSRKLFKQGWKAKFDKEEAVVQKEDDSILVLSKTIPDIILDASGIFAFILNVTQAEYILEIDSLFVSALNNASSNLREYNLMKSDTIESFISEVSKKNNYMRKLHKIEATHSYQYFHNNINRIPEVLKLYNLNVKFDEQNGMIIFDDETDVSDVLHLFADDYVKRHISQKDDVIK